MYQLEGLSGEISAYAINADNSLTLVQEVSGFLPEIDTQGLVTLQRNEAEVGFLLGDCNLDGVVSFLDIQPFIDALTSGSFLDHADINGDGTVSFLDISGFIALLSSGG